MRVWEREIRPLAIAVVSLTMLAGCAVQGADYQHVAPASDKASIYVYRTYPTAGFGSAAQVIINCGDNAVGLGPGGYHRFTVPPGQILCSSHSENTAQVVLNAQPGHDYYLRQSLSMGFVQPRVSLQEVDAEAAQADIQKCKQQ
jgi:hypothetical protein